MNGLGRESGMNTSGDIFEKALFRLASIHLAFSTTAYSWAKDSNSVSTMTPRSVDNWSKGNGKLLLISSDTICRCLDLATLNVMSKNQSREIFLSGIFQKNVDFTCGANHFHMVSKHVATRVNKNENII